MTQRTVVLAGQDWDVSECSHPKLGDGFEIDFTEMFEPPGLSYDWMTELAEKFGTKDIDFDNVSQGGCETCDYGSKYGYRIQVYNSTRNNPLHRAGQKRKPRKK